MGVLMARTITIGLFITELAIARMVINNITVKKKFILGSMIFAFLPTDPPLLYETASSTYLKNLSEPLLIWTHWPDCIPNMC